MDLLSRLKPKEITCPRQIAPSTFTKLHFHQQEGITWLLSQKDGCLLADEMGLGKTALAILWLHARHDNKKNSIVVLPKSLLSNWEAEVSMWAPALQTYLYHGPKRALPKGKGHIILTTYEVMTKDINLFPSFSCIIWDEVQALKNNASKRYQAASQLSAPCRLALSGTPIENSLADLRNIMQLICPDQKWENYSDKKLVSMAKKRILKRQKDAYRQTLGTKRQDHTVHLCFSLTESWQYKRLARGYYKKLLKDGKTANFLAALTALKRYCAYPELQGGKGHGPKGLWLSGHLKKCHKEKTRTLVFSQYRDVVLRLADDFRSDYPVYVLHGGLSHAERNKVLEKWKASPPGSVFFISLKAGGVGLNLTEASHVVHYDSWWNPALTDQASARADRIGQQNVAQIWSLQLGGTVEDHVQKITFHKRELQKLLRNQSNLRHALGI